MASNQPSIESAESESNSSTNDTYKCCLRSKSNCNKSPDGTNMSKTRKWLRRLRRSLSCSNSVSLLDGGDTAENTPQAETIFVHELEVEPGTRLLFERILSPEKQAAATKIESCFRGHLARRAFRALKSLVKLQAMFRGVYIRRQSEIAIRCMQILVCLQIKVRSRQLVHLSRRRSSY